MITKKLILRSALLLIIGLTVAIVIYPILHEFGHIASTILVGGKIKEITFFPAQSVLTVIDSLSGKKQIFIGISGNLLPVIISLMLQTKRYPLWYVTTFLRLINIYYLILNIIYAITYNIGVPIDNNDISTMLSVQPRFFPVILIGNVILIAFLCISIKKSAPISTILAYLY